ncbi:MAG: hypothetical protein R2862_09425 [Thermoanaerobaculia bacterium]
MHGIKSNHWGTNSTGQMDDLQTDSWLDFQMFQSGQNSGANQLTLLTQRARELAWRDVGNHGSLRSRPSSPREAGGER